MYSDEIKTEAFNRHSRGIPVTEICKNLGVSRSTIFLWIQQSRPDYRGIIPRKEYLEKVELERLRLENRIFRTCGCTPKSPLSERLKAIDQHKNQFNVYRL